MARDCSLSRRASRTVAMALCVAGVVGIATPLARAGGIGLYEVDAQDVGLAAAGYAARAQDPATVFTNPAGMSRLEGSQALFSATPLYGHIEFTPDASTTTAGGDGGNALGWYPTGSLFLSHRLTDSVSVGFGAFSYFGLGVQYTDDWVGRFYVQEASLAGLSLMPAVSVKLCDQLSVGAGFNAMNGQILDKVAIHNLEPGRGDGQLKYQDNEWGYGGNFGVLFEPVKGTRIGLTYLTPVDLNFKDSPSLSNVGPALAGLAARRDIQSLSIDVTVPQQAMLSLYQELNPQWAILANAGWQDWSQFGQVNISIDSATPRSITTKIDYTDTWHVALGVQYRANDKWMFSTGVAYDSSMLDDSQRGPSLPVGEAWRWGIGAQYALSQDLFIGLAYELAWSGDLSVDVNRGPLAGHVSGEYQSTAVHFVSASLLWKF